MRTYERDHYLTTVRLARVRAKQLRKHAAWLQTAVGPASYEMQNDMHASAERLEVMAQMFSDLLGLEDGS